KMLWDLLSMPAAPNEDWWLESYLAIARPLEGDATVYEPRGGIYTDYRGPVWRYVENVIRKAKSEGLSILDACQRWHAGAFLMETLPSVLYILMHHANNPEEALIRAVNDTKDNDSIAAIVGAAVGAIHGFGRFPKPWLNHL